MLYGWVYPQLVMVLMIMVTYSWVAPLLMPFGVLFFLFSYTMYKYQLLYVYINNDQSGGFMWYAVFNRSLVALMFAILTLLGYLGLRIGKDYARGPFFFLLPVPFGIIYFWRYVDNRFKKTSMVSIVTAADL
jgi:calcium permeable stress-gated cation channel